MDILAALAPLRHRLWLIIGTSIDHDLFKLLCNHFKQERTLELQSGLMTCNLPPISFSLAFWPNRGLLTRKTSQGQARLLDCRDVESHVQRLRSAGS